MKRALVATLVVALLAACVGCSGGRSRSAWDVRALAERTPALAAIRGHGLRWMVPYGLPWGGELVWWTCRWPEDRPVRVGFDASVTAGERELLRVALAAWESTGIGIRFVVADDGAAGDVAFRVGSSTEGFSGLAAVECGIDLASFVPGADRVDARLVEAVIDLRRDEVDSVGRRVPMSEKRFVGVALHEIGHALGYQGHTRGGRSIMRREVRSIEGTGAGLLQGDTLREPTLEALYAVPNGTVVKRQEIAGGDMLERLATAAAERGYAGPSVRVGDESARVRWWDASGREVHVRIPDVVPLLRGETELVLEPDPVAAAWLGPAPPP